MNRLLIKGSRLVTEEGIKAADLMVCGDVIEKIAPEIPTPSGAREIDARGMITMPGIIDPHVHFELRAYNSVSSDDFYSGSRAAAAGGITTFLDFAIPENGESLEDAVSRKRRSAQSKSIVDYSFHAQITGWNPEMAAGMRRLADGGITSFKIFMPATENWGVDDAGIYGALKISADSGSLVMVHAENGALVSAMSSALAESGKMSMEHYPFARPAIAEQEAVQRACLLAAEASAPVYICHLSSGAAARELRRLRRGGSDIFVETCPQYLLLSDELYLEKEGCLAACAPPLRKKNDNLELWRAVIEGTVDVIGTDHCPFLRDEKLSGGGRFPDTPMGLPGIETSLALMYTEGALLRDMGVLNLYKLMSLNPSKIFGLYPEKGTLREGSHADLVILNPSPQYEHPGETKQSRCDWSPYAAWKLTGRPEYTFSRGEKVYEKGRITAEKGRGRFLRRKVSDYII